MKPKGYWQNPEHRRAFLIAFAKERGFDQMDTESWALVSKAQIRAHGVRFPLIRFSVPTHRALLK